MGGGSGGPGVRMVLEKNGAIQVGAVRLEAARVKVVGGGGGGPSKNGAVGVKAVWGGAGPGGGGPSGERSVWRRSEVGTSPRKNGAVWVGAVQVERGGPGGGGPCGGGPRWGWSGWGGPKFRAFFPFPTLFFQFLEAFHVFFRGLVKTHKFGVLRTSCEAPTAPEVRGKRVQGWGFQGTCYRLKESGLRQQNWSNKTFGLALKSIRTPWPLASKTRPE